MRRLQNGVSLTEYSGPVLRGRRREEEGGEGEKEESEGEEPLVLGRGTSGRRRGTATHCVSGFTLNRNFSELPYSSLLLSLASSPTLSFQPSVFFPNPFVSVLLPF